MVEYQVNHSLHTADIIRVFDASGIKRPTQDAARIEKMFAQANLVISAWSGPKLIGVCRALTDYSYCCYLSDIAVDAAYQKQGIGSAMIGKVKAAIGDKVALILLSAPGAMAYYPKAGFEPVENGFIIKRLG